MAIILLLCLLSMPYGYYILVRFVTMVFFCWVAFKKYQRKDELGVLFSIAIALLFQPFFKIPLGRMIWNIADIIIAMYLLFLFFTEQKHTNTQEKDIRN